MDLRRPRAECMVQKVVLRWDRFHAKAYKLQVSTDAGPSARTGFVENWTDVHQTDNGQGDVEEIVLPKPVKTRYVRLFCTKQGTDNGFAPRFDYFTLREFEVYGTGGPAPVGERPALSPAEDGTWNLSGGWKLYSESFVADDAAKVSTCGYDNSRWLPAVVPGTVLTSYLAAGAIPDMFYGDQQFQVSDWFCRSDWWYRTEMELPQDFRGKRVWLNFDGINHKADIFVNGHVAGKMSGAFLRGRFDVTDKVVAGRKNCVAVLIHPMPIVLEPTVKRLDQIFWADCFTPNAPTFVESAEWDWLPTIRDRNIGIWNRVFLRTSGDVTINDPFVITDLPLLPERSRADLTVKVELRNNSDRRQSGVLRGKIGEIEFAQPATLGPRETQAMSINKSTQPVLSIQNPKLWWPNGYGPQNLYDFSLRFEPEEGGVSDVKTAKIGIRKFTYQKVRPFTVFCNGQRILLRGADWGMDEGMLRCDRQGFEARLRMEKDMNFNILRNCLGNVSKEDFFDLCDRYGLMVWEEFGINHETTPVNIDTFMANARDRLLARRNHACVLLWCTANEGGPTEPIASAMPKLVAELDGTRFYQRHSTMAPTDGDGTYDTRRPTFYFENTRGFHPECGSHTVPAVESMRRMMPHEKLWPISQTWATHNWLNAGNSPASKPTEEAIARYGVPTGIEDFCRKAQMVNMETFKAIYEACNDKMWNDCTGVMIWMSNPCWPSLAWNTYDYYFEPTAAYFACKNACQPIHVQWNCATGEVKVVNATLRDLHGLTAEASVWNLDGSERFRQSAQADCPANSVQRAFNLSEDGKGQAGNGPADLRFIKLMLKDRSGQTLSDNFYWQSRPEGAYGGLAAMSKVRVSGGVENSQKDGVCRIVVDLRNQDKGVALMARLKVVDENSGLLVAPIMYSDNYFSLTPGETKRVTIEFNAKNVAGSQALLLVEGWNVAPSELARLRIEHP